MNTQGIEKLGHVVKDKVTGFKGRVTGFVIYLSGCNQCLVTPEVDDKGGMRESVWMDQQRLDVDTSVPAIVLDNEHTPGFDVAPPRY